MADKLPRDPIERARLVLSRRVRIHTRRLNVFAFMLRERDMTVDEAETFVRESETVHQAAVALAISLRAEARAAPAPQVGPPKTETAWRELADEV